MQVTQLERFLSGMSLVVFWRRLMAWVKPKYLGLEHMLRPYFAQQWPGLSDEEVENAVCESAAFRHFIGLDLQAVPNATTLLEFRHSTERHALTRAMSFEANSQLESKGLPTRKGTSVHVIILATPSLTKNKVNQCARETASTKKVCRYHSGMMASTGVGADSDRIHGIQTTAANEHDLTHRHEQLYGQVGMVSTDADYITPQNREVIGQIREHGQTRNELDSGSRNGAVRATRLPMEDSRRIPRRLKKPRHRSEPAQEQKSRKQADSNVSKSDCTSQPRR